MNRITRAARRFALALPLLTLAPAVHAAAPAKRAAPARVAPARAASPIIALPLNPVVPAAQRTCAAKTASGLGYTALQSAEGAKAADDYYVLVNYIGYLAATGAVFDQNMQSPMEVSGVIPGFAEGLKLIPKGGIYRLCVPAALGYGAQASGPIPANSSLVFQVEVLDMRSAAEVEAMRKAQGAQVGAPGGAAPQP